MAISIGQMVANIFGFLDGDQRIPEHMRKWFQTEYGREWRFAYEHYRRTGNIHYRQ